VTTAYTDLDIPAGTEGVHAPQEDSQLLVDVMEKTGLPRASTLRWASDHGLALWNSGRTT
jgi:hypothetical protein